MFFHDGLRTAMPKRPATAQIFRAPLLILFFCLIRLKVIAHVLVVQVSWFIHIVDVIPPWSPKVSSAFELLFLVSHSCDESLTKK